jgi:hypothetical protein
MIGSVTNKSKSFPEFRRTFADLRTTVEFRS